VINLYFLQVKKRQLILTNKPRIIYVDTKKMVQKGEVPWSTHIRPEAKNNTAWFIHTVSIPMMKISQLNKFSFDIVAKENLHIRGYPW
jgi:hypothetical protein